MDPTRPSMFLVRLSSALRTALACIIVGCTTLYGPAPIRRLLAFPAFAYMTTILIVPDATLGDTLRGFWCALSASLQTLASSILIFKVIGPAKFTPALATIAVASCTFLVALPESIPLMSKRIAFGQIVIVYVTAVVQGAQIAVVMHPVHVVSSTAFGALASVLAMLVPFPRLAHFEARKACRLYIDNALDRLNLFVEAFAGQDNTAATDLIPRAKCMAERGVQHLQNIKDVQRSMMWEKHQIRFCKCHCTNLLEKLHDIEIKMRGLEIAITKCPSFPVGIIDDGLREVLVRMKEKICPKLEKAKFAPFRAKTDPEAMEKVSESTHWNPETSPVTTEDLSSFFFMYCLQLLQDDSSIDRSQECISEKIEKEEPQDSRNTKDQRECSITKTRNSLIRKIDKERWSFAAKCSLSLGLAVLLGLIFNRDQGYWSGLTIAISFVEGRQATFITANARAQGTAMGSVYGILWCFIFHTSVILRFLPLLPWIIFTSFLRHSKMYGQAGSVAAVVGALLILGRKNYGQPSQFAIARTTEACIGLLCFIILETAMQPKRAATVAKTELVWSLKALQSCVRDMSFSAAQKSMSSSGPWDLRMKQEILESHVNDLEKFISLARVEPNFWFMPFNDPCYGKLLESLRQMTDLLLLAACEIENLLELSERVGPDWEELEELLNYDLHIFREKVTSSLKFLEEVVSTKSLEALEKKLRTKKEYFDPEIGQCSDTAGEDRLGPEDAKILEIVATFLQHSDKVANTVNALEAEQQFKSRMKICLSALGFCIYSLMQGTKDIENQVKELVIWENPSRHINLGEISRKISRLQSK